jgi:methionine-rich copper-binding protein CopC
VSGGLGRAAVRALAAGALVLTVALLAAPAASAHEVLVGSDPPDGASLSATPSRVTLTFDNPVQAGFTTMTVVGPDGGRWEQGPVVEQSERISVGVHRLGPAGRYRVGYRIVSSDGHPVSGEVAFTLTAAQGGTPDPASAGPASAAAAPAGAPPAASPAASTSDDGGGGLPAWPFVVVAVVVVGGAVVLALRRRT